MFRVTHLCVIYARLEKSSEVKFKLNNMWRFSRINA